MRIVLTGATGNVGTSVLPWLIADARVESVVGVARRRPELSLPKVEWRSVDVGVDDLAPVVRGADAVIHLAWMIQPQHDEASLFRTNVIGTNRLLAAVAQERVPVFVHASSVGAYAPGPKEPVDETWPVTGVPTCIYSRQKAMVERSLDAFERTHPRTRVVRMRTSLVFKRQAASEIARLFLGPLVPRRLLGPRTLPVVPDVSGVRVQATHADDVGMAYHLAATTAGVHGAFNVAADPVLDASVVADALGKRRAPLPAAPARGLLWLTWRLRMQPVEEGWLDMGRATPLMDATRIRRELGWAPTRTSLDALVDLLEGMRERAGGPTPPLEPGRSGTLVPIASVDAPSAHALAGV